MNKKLIEEYMEEVWNKKNLKVIDNLFAENAIVHSPLGTFKTPKEMAETVQQWLEAIPDIHVSLLNTVEENGLVVSHWQAKGTHQKMLNGIEARGNPVSYQGTTLHRFENGKVVEYWAYLDSWSLMAQMRDE